MSSNKHVENYNIYERKVMKKNLLHNCKSAQDVQQKKQTKKTTGWVDNMWHTEAVVLKCQAGAIFSYSSLQNSSIKTDFDQSLLLITATLYHSPYWAPWVSQQHFKLGVLRLNRANKNTTRSAKQKEMPQSSLNTNIPKTSCNV